MTTKHDILTENAAFKAFNLLLLGPEPADADTDDEYDERFLADPIGPAVEPFKTNKHTSKPDCMRGSTLAGLKIQSFYKFILVCSYGYLTS